MTDSAAPPDGLLDRALALASRAPSAHNTQPWLWRPSGSSRVDLFLDPHLVLRHADQDGRSARISLGAALHHLQLALAVEGRAAKISRYPKTFDKTHIARVEFGAAHIATEDEEALVDAIGRRRSDRRGYDARPIPHDVLGGLVDRVPRHDLSAHLVTDRVQRTAIANAVRAAAAAHAQDSNYQLELASWSGLRSPDEGVPTTNLARSAPEAELPARVFAGPTPVAVADSGATGDLLIISSEIDDSDAHVRAGEATSEVLLAATSSGLASCPMTEPLEVAGPRREITDAVLGGGAVPLMIVRIGWPSPDAPPLPAAPRRSQEDIVMRGDR